MLSELAIKNFAIIDDLRISFSHGLSVLTGETGAGKSIIIEAVNLLLGGRASADLVRTGETSAELEACFDIAPDAPAAGIMAAQGLDPSEGLIIRRIINTNGRHRIFINSTQATMQLLKQVTANLASISSQHAHQTLLSEDNHLDILDHFANTWPLRNQVHATCNELVPLIRELEQLKANIEKLAEEQELIQFQIDDIDKAGILPDEDKNLETRKQHLKNGSEIFNGLNTGVEKIYSGEGSLLEELGNIKAVLEKHGHLDEKIRTITDKLSRTMFDLEDITDDMRKLCATIDLDPASLEETEARLDLIQKLKRKYGKPSLEALFAFHANLKEKIAGTGNMAARIEAMEEQCISLSQSLGRKALKLSEARRKAAKKLATLAENELKTLEMDQIRFTIAVTQTPSSKAKVQQELFTENRKQDLLSVKGMKITDTGMDKVSFLMAPNPGENPRPLARIASGGELSRVVLALKAILSDTDVLGTLVFDEVDSGIGGKTSDKVGIKLKALSEKYQVICITHLAQIAKYGKTHYKIEKQVVNQRTATMISPLTDKEDRIREIARMMGGSTITKVTLDHAAEMLTN